MREKLVVIGPDYLDLNPQRLATEAGVSERVFHAPHAPMDDLLHLYRGATAFVLPTQHEGFSLTIPEAMACGAPAIVFDHVALEGGLREAALIVEPPTAQALAGALARVAGDIALRKGLREAGLSCAKRFRWEETARRTMSILAAAAGSGSNVR